MSEKATIKKTCCAVAGSSIQATYEVGFVLLPVLIWAILLLSTGGSYDDVYKLPAWSFATLSLFCTTLRDGITAFHQDTPKDRREREVLVLVSLIGVVLSTLLLSLAVLHNQGAIPSFQSMFYDAVWWLLIVAILMSFVTKSILLQRRQYDRYV